MKTARFEQWCAKESRSWSPRLKCWRRAKLRAPSNHSRIGERESVVRIRVQARAASVVALIVAVLMGWLCYAFFGHRHVTTQARPAAFRSTADALQSTNAPLILAAADHFYWLNNGPAAAPLYARAEKLFSESGDKRNELHAHIGRLRWDAETMSFADLLAEGAFNPVKSEHRGVLRAVQHACCL